MIMVKVGLRLARQQVNKDLQALRALRENLELAETLCSQMLITLQARIM